MYKNYFSFPGSLGKTFKDSYKLLIMSCVLCSDDFFIKRLISKKKKKRKKERKGVSGPRLVSFLSRSSMHYIPLTLHNSNKPAECH